MATIDATDIATLVAKVQAQVPDYDDLVPDGSTLSALVTSVAPGLLDYVNSRIGTRYAEQVSPLPAVLLTVLSYGTIAEIQYLAYRRMKRDESEWPDRWWSRLELWCDRIASGKANLPGVATTSTATPAVRGEPRQFTTDSETYTSITDLDSIL